MVTGSDVTMSVTSFLPSFSPIARQARAGKSWQEWEVAYNFSETGEPTAAVFFTDQALYYMLGGWREAD